MSNWLGVWTMASWYPGFLIGTVVTSPETDMELKNWVLVEVSPCPVGGYFQLEAGCFKGFWFHRHEVCIDSPRNSQDLDRKSWKWVFFFRRQNSSQTSSCTGIFCSRIRFCSRDVQDITSILSFGSSGDLWCVILNPEHIEYLVQSTASLWISITPQQKRLGTDALTDEYVFCQICWEV